MRKKVENIVREVVNRELGKGSQTYHDTYRDTTQISNRRYDRRPLVAANWKMNMDIEKARRYAKVIKENMPKKDVEILICPPYYLLLEMKKMLEGSTITLGGQNVYPEKNGAFTGEISCDMLRDAGCNYVIIGHSERRNIIGESDDLINKKVNSALSSGLRPILCIGELLKEREERATFRVVKNQLKVDLYRTDVNLAEEIVIAYEPVWAIGTGRNATPEQVEEVHSYIREVLSEIYNYNAAKRIRILYGGSVNPENAKDIAKCKNVDGFLVGSASLDAEKFVNIANVF